MDSMSGVRPGATPRSVLISGPRNHLIDGERQIREENSGARLGEFTPRGSDHGVHDAPEPPVECGLAGASPFQRTSVQSRKAAKSMRIRSLPIPATKTLAMVFLLMAAFGLGRATSGTGTASAENDIAMESTGSPESAATATRAAELAELSDLRTQVADGLVCTPAATATATPTPVPPVAAGAPMPYGEDWTVTVKDVALRPTFGSSTAKGVYVQVNITAVNNATTPQSFPYDDLVLRDASGRVFLPALDVKVQNEGEYFMVYPPSVPTDGFVVFDAPADAKGPFILESTTVSTFRVMVEEAARG